MGHVLFLKSIKGDGRGDVERSVAYLYDLQKSKDTTPPLAQIITIIKYEKPVLYSILKQRFQKNMGMKILFELDFDYEQAKHSLIYE